jgi:hypothetical protein
MSLNTLQKNSLLSELADLNIRIKRLEAMLQGQPIDSVRIKDAAITDAKIVSLSADKITTGQLSATTNIDIGDSDDGDYIRMDGNNIRIVMYKDGTAQLVIGDV